MTTALDLENQGGRGGQRLLREIWGVIRPHQRLLWFSLLLLLLTSACRLALPYLVMTVIDGYLTVAAPDRAGLWRLVGAFFAIAFSEALLRRWQQISLDRAGQNALFDLRLRVFDHLQRLPARFFDRMPTGRLVGRVTTDVEALQEMFSSGVVTVLGDLVFLVAAVVILLSLSTKLTLATMLMVPVLLVVTLFVRTRARRAYTAMRSRLSQLNGFLHEQVSGMSVVQLFGRQRDRQDDFDGISGGVRGAQLHTVRWESSLSAITELLGAVTTALILWYGGSLALGVPAAEISAGTGLTLGVLVAFVDYMQRFFGPLNDLSMKYTVMQNALVASERIFELLDVPAERVDPATPARAEGGGAIEFRDVTFAYSEGQPVLRNVSFRVRAGETVAIVGATGAGKSTILGLIGRLYEIDDVAPGAGAILLDDVDVRDLARTDLRRQVGVVAQDVFLFEGTILENIRLGRPDITDEEAMASAAELGLDEVVARFPAGYHEPVAERGKNLSAGEKQLIAFARMLAVAPDVLALDEATANVDSHTEEMLQEAVHRLMEGRTALIIAHRLSTVRDADRILVLHKGELVEEGTHDELLALGGCYWRLHELQFEDEEPLPDR